MPGWAAITGLTFSFRTVYTGAKDARSARSRLTAPGPAAARSRPAALLSLAHATARAMPEVGRVVLIDFLGATVPAR